LEFLTVRIEKRTKDWSEALTILRSIKDPTAIPYIVRLLADNQIRTIMMRHLAKFPEPAALSVLLDIVAQGDPQGTVRDARDALVLAYGESGALLKIQDLPLRARVESAIAGQVHPATIVGK
jgi:hypothetical protein